MKFNELSMEPDGNYPAKITLYTDARHKENVQLTIEDDNLVWIDTEGITHQLDGGGGGGGTDTNFANADLTLDGNRTHDLNGHTLDFNFASNSGSWFQISAMPEAETNFFMDATGIALYVLPSGISVSNQTVTVKGPNVSIEFDNLQLHNNGNGAWVGFVVPSDADSATIYTLPATDGTAGQVLSTDGNGNLSWITP
jgi:hypothetical protein